jgi:hypothetical protein
MAVVALGTLSAWLATAQNRPYGNDRGYRYERDRDRDFYGNALVPAGTPMDVRLATEVSTENANVGDQWTGTLDRPVMRRGQILIPEGSQVVGVVTASQQGTHETRPEIDLAVRRVMVNGRMRSLTADTEPIVGESNRAKKIGAIVGGAAVGGLVGHAISHEHGGLIGGLLGGAAGYGATRHAFRTLTLRPGSEIVFTTSQELMVWR